MELWFILALISSLFAGLHVFIQKVGATRGYNSSLLNSYSAGISAILSFIVAWIYEGFSEFSLLMLFVALLSGLIFIIASNLRMDSLRYIDATIFFPLHKFIAPLIALIVSITFFAEKMNLSEWAGVVLGIIVPLLLIHSSEKTRQKNLTKGLTLMVMSAIFSAIAVSVNKEGADLFSSVILFAALANFFGTVFAAFIYRFRKKDLGQDNVETHYLDPKLLKISFISGVVQITGFGALILAFDFGGPLAIVYTINSLYILVPIILAITFYKEHWNARKVFAIVLSLGAILLMR